MITDIKGLEYGGKWHKYFWDPSVNPEATVRDGLADCTCFVLGDVAAEGLPRPVSPIPNASDWHTCLTNGWHAIPYKASDVEVGDIIEWTNGCHVVRVSKIEGGKIYISGSFYTGIHGKAYYNGKFDVRTGINTLQQLSDYMIKNYPVRFFHYWTVEDENRWVGYSPKYILKKPVNVKPVSRDTSVDQVEVLIAGEQNIRNNNNTVVGVAEKGWYNSYGSKDSNGYTWYRIGDDRWIAGMKNRVVFYPATIKEDAQDTDLTRELKAEISSLKTNISELKEKLTGLEGKLKDINKISSI